MVPEKLEYCPQCGQTGKFWHYDFQRCEGCGYAGMQVGFKPMAQSEAVKEMLRERLSPLNQDALEHAYAAFPPEKRDKNLIASAVRAYVDAA